MSGSRRRIRSSRIKMQNCEYAQVGIEQPVQFFTVSSFSDSVCAIFRYCFRILVILTWENVWQGDTFIHFIILSSVRSVLNVIKVGWLQMMSDRGNNSRFDMMIREALLIGSESWTGEETQNISKLWHRSLESPIHISLAQTLFKNK